MTFALLHITYQGTQPLLKIERVTHLVNVSLGLGPDCLDVREQLMQCAVHLFLVVQGALLQPCLCVCHAGKGLLASVSRLVNGIVLCEVVFRWGLTSVLIPSNKSF